MGLHQHRPQLQTLVRFVCGILTKEIDCKQKNWSPHMKFLLIGAAGFFLFLIILGGCGISMHNGLVNAEETVAVAVGRRRQGLLNRPRACR